MRADIESLDDLPQAFDALSTAAEAEGYAFLGRLRQLWRAGAYDADRSATLRAAYVDGVLVGLGAQTLDAYDGAPGNRRIRHFYVAPPFRRRGIGRALANALIADALGCGVRVHLRATHDLSTAFWDSVGFARVAHATRTHEMAAQ